MRVALALLLSLAVLAGCGGDDEFREEANAICARYDEDIEAVETPTSNAELVESAGEIGDLMEAQLEELRDLDAPGDLEDEWDEYLQSQEDGVAIARDIAAAAEDDDQALIIDLAGQAERLESTSDILTDRLELDRCRVNERGGGETTGGSDTTAR